MKPIVLVLISIVLAACGQITMKMAMTGGQMDVMSPVETALKIMSRPLVYLGLLFYGSSAFLWLISLNKMPLTYIYPFTALIIVIVTLASTFLLGEGFAVWTLWRIGGVACICTGLLMMSMG
jgi:multidrug transporter EmrE-like cation transporter